MEAFIKFFILGTIPNEVCKNHVYEMLKSIKGGDLWALQMLDASSKLPLGLMTGNFGHYGNMDECLSVKVNGKFGNFTGKHCIMGVPIPTPKNLFANIPNAVKYYNGLCIPSTCSGRDLEFLFKYWFRVQADIDELRCVTENDERPFEPREMFTILLIAILLILSILSAIYDNWKTSGKKNKLFLTFSLTRNFKTLIDMSAPPGTIMALNGIRFIAISAVVLAHIYMLSLLGQNFINPIRYFTWLSDWAHIFITSRGIMLDALFVMGGMLTTYVFLKDREKGKKFNFFIYLIHRVTRLGPAMYMVMLFQTTLMNRLSSAAQWRRISKEIEQGCVENWWQNFLFINSWFGSLKTCMGHTWYISVDMQLYIISPLLLIPLHRKPKLGIWLTGGAIVAFFLGSFISSFILEEHADLFPHENGWEEFLYMVPYNRATPWLIGILFGYYMNMNKHKKVSTNDVNTSNHKIRSVSSILRKWIISTTWCSVGLGLGLGIMYLVHPFLQRGYPFSAFEHAIYISTSHIVASLSILLMVAAILTGYGGLMDLVLSAKIFAPLGRLSYSIYLIHIIIVEVWYLGSKTNYYLSDENLFINFVTVLMYSVIFSPILFLLVEQPFTNLEKLLLQTGTTSESQSERKPIILPEIVTQCNSYENNALELTQRSNKGLV